MTAVFSAVAQIPNTLTSINTAIQAGRTVVQIPSAVVGAMPSAAAPAIVGLGIEMVIFLLKTAEAIKQDIEGVVDAMQNTQQTETDLQREAQAGADAFARMYGPNGPTSTNGPYAGAGPRTAVA